jgi:hypothetical protein
MLVAAVPAWAEPEDPPPPTKSESIRQVAAQESLPAPIQEPPAPEPTQNTPTPATVKEASAPAPEAQLPESPLADHHIGPTEHWWAQGEYLLWWLKSGPLPQPLLTTGASGVLGDPTTRVLLGNSTLDYRRASGFRFNAGGWIGDCHYWGVEAGGFYLEQKKINQTFASDAIGNPLLARPFTDLLASPSAQSALLVSSPGVATGSFALSSSARLWGTEINVVRNLYASPRFRADMLFGFHYLDLSEDLLLVQQTNALATGALGFQNGSAVSSDAIVDGFHTRNQVYAGQLGVHVDGRFGAASVQATAKVGLGPNHQTITAAGSTTSALLNGTTSTVPGGLLALPGTNIGQANDNVFVIVPQVDVRFGYQMTEHLQLFVGYDFLLINEVTRPGNQITLNVNSAFIPSSPNFGAMVGPPQPSHLTKRDEFWAQGLAFGIEFRY